MFRQVGVKKFLQRRLTSVFSVSSAILGDAVSCTSNFEVTRVEKRSDNLMQLVFSKTLFWCKLWVMFFFLCCFRLDIISFLYKMHRCLENYHGAFCIASGDLNKITDITQFRKSTYKMRTIYFATKLISNRENTMGIFIFLPKIGFSLFSI